MSELYELYKKLGKENYGEAIGKIAPYFATIDPQFVELRPGFCEVVIKNEHRVHNHLGTMHAIAICNGAELVAGLTTDVSIPDTHRWIPIEMTVKYLAMAKTDVRVVADGESIDWARDGNIVVSVDAFNTENKKIFEARITMKVNKK